MDNSQVVTAEKGRVFLVEMRRRAVAVALLATTGGALAQGATYNYKYEETLNRQTEVQALKDDLFGDAISYVDGGISFKVTDIQVPNGSGPWLKFSRQMQPPRSAEGGGMVGDAEYDQETLGQNWQLDIPTISGIYPTTSEFIAPGDRRCSRGRVAPDVVRTYPYNTLQSNIFAYNFWHGLNMNLPGIGEEPIQPLTATAVLPQDGAKYWYQTASGARIACLQSLKNGAGEGFLVLDPAGNRYWFDWIASRKVRGLRVPDGSAIGSTVINRKELSFFVSRVEDRFGNYVTYSYDATHPYRLVSMASSSGARIDVSYDDKGRVSTASTGNRAWKYTYEADPGWPIKANLVRVDQPDGSAWTYAYTEGMFAANPDLGSFGNRCDFSPLSMTSDGAGAVAKFQATHPSGAIGRFKFKAIVHGSNNVSNGNCEMVVGSTSVYRLMSGRPKATPLNTLIEKSISGVGMSAVTWMLRYEPSWSYASQCASGCPTTSRTTVTRNDGVTETYVFGNDFGRNANQLLKRTISQSGVVLRVEDYVYVTSADGQPFADYAVGPESEDLSNSLSNPFNRKNRPQLSKVIIQDGSTFSRRILQFDQFARPVRVESSH